MPGSASMSPQTSVGSRARDKGPAHRGREARQPVVEAKTFSRGSRSTTRHTIWCNPVLGLPAHRQSQDSQGPPLMIRNQHPPPSTQSSAPKQPLRGCEDWPVTHCSLKGVKPTAWGWCRWGVGASWLNQQKLKKKVTCHWCLKTRHKEGPSLSGAIFNPATTCQSALSQLWPFTAPRLNPTQEVYGHLAWVIVRDRVESGGRYRVRPRGKGGKREGVWMAASAVPVGRSRAGGEGEGED